MPSKSLKAWNRISQDYASEITSPLLHATTSLLKDKIENLPKNSRILDLGCGPGHLLPLLTKRGREIVAVDFSAGMLEMALQFLLLNSPDDLKKTQFLQDDLTVMEMVGGKFDIIMSINSIIAPDILDLHKIFHNISKKLAAQGEWIGVFPAMESIHAEFQHCYFLERQAGASEKAALKTTREKLEFERIDFEKGTYQTDDMVQKYFLLDELEAFFKANQLRLKRVEKLTYSPQFSFNYFDEDLKGHPPMWDWYVEIGH